MKSNLFIIGLDDNGNSSFTKHVLLDGPTLTKSVMIMEDLSCWKSASPSYPISKEQMVLCLKNVAVLHAKFWGLKNVDSLNIGISKVEQDTRQASYQKMAKTVLKKLVKSPNLFRKVQNSMLKCKLLNTWFQRFQTLNSAFSIRQF